MKKQLIIEGGNKLKGVVHISGSKNAAIPCLAAALLTKDTVVLENVPFIKDIELMKEILNQLGVKINFNHQNKKITINAISPKFEIPPDLSKQLRGSTIFMGGLLSRIGHFRIYNYGGCPIGQRPIDFHLNAFRLLGAKVNQNKEYLECSAQKLKGTEIIFDFPSVGATENVIIAACLAEGKTLIRNIAIEPEIINLINMLIKMGANIKINSYKREISIIGKKTMTGAKHKIIPDRIEAGTYAIAAGITNSEIVLENVNINHMRSINSAFRQMGLNIRPIKKNRLHLIPSEKKIKPIEIITRIYPAFPTDMQPQFTAIATQAQGTSKIVETMYNNRFHHVQELVKMGANIRVSGNEIIVTGDTPLIGTKVEVKDLRGGASLVLAALQAKGTTKITNAEKIYRGYERIDDKLNKLGAKIDVIEYAE